MEHSLELVQEVLALNIPRMIALDLLKVLQCQKMIPS